MYRLIVARIIRSTWHKINSGDTGAAVAKAHPDVVFEFVGSTPISARLQGREAFGEWFHTTVQALPGLRFDVRDVLVSGPPWNTRVAVRMDVSAPLEDGGVYRNHAVQFLTLRWGRMVDDWVLEDTAALDAQLAKGSGAAASSGSG